MINECILHDPSLEMVAKRQQRHGSSIPDAFSEVHYANEIWFVPQQMGEMTNLIIVLG